jgi:UDP-glucuronate decarboxylase
MIPSWRLDMRSVLISGGNGFLGYHLSKKFLSNGFSVSVIDDLSTSKKSDLLDKVTFYNKRVEDFVTDEKFEYVIHLAARPSPEDYISSPVDTILSNSFGTKAMLEIARKSNATFMYTSSSEVYGNASVLPTPESYYGYVNPNGIRSCYDESKRFSEALIMAFRRQHQMKVRIQRPFNVYGPRIREDGIYGRVIPRFIMQALENSDITVHGEGSQTRSFLYIDDWINATLKFLFKESVKHEVLNIGSDSEITINELANMIVKMTHSRSKIVHIAAREDDPQRRSADLTLVRSELGWSPTVKVEEGLSKTIEWFRMRSR